MYIFYIINHTYSFNKWNTINITSVVYRSIYYCSDVSAFEKFLKASSDDMAKCICQFGTHSLNIDLFNMDYVMYVYNICAQIDIRQSYFGDILIFTTKKIFKKNVLIFEKKKRPFAFRYFLMNFSFQKLRK